MITDTILCGDALATLRTLPSESVHCVISSPPYWGLRDYGVAGQIGLEATPEEWCARMVDVFAEVRRVLRRDGTLWLNLGDCYATSANGISAAQIKASGKDDRTYRDKPFSTIAPGFKAKDLIGLPWMLAFALRADGWWLRSDVVWHKPNPMPESVADRPSRAHEYMFLLSKSGRYYYDAEAVRTPLQPKTFTTYGSQRHTTHGNDALGKVKSDNWARSLPDRQPRLVDKQRGHSRRHAGFNDRWDQMEKGEQQAAGANLRDVWTVATQPFPGSHFATFPPKLIEPCILAGTSPRNCETCGAPWVRVVERSGGTIGQSWHDHTDDLGNGQRVALKAGKGQITRVGDAPGYQRISHGFRPSCRCQVNTGAAHGIVLDPFMGAGTVGVVARRHGRHYLGIELNPDYVTMATERIANEVQPVLWTAGEATA